MPPWRYPAAVDRILEEAARSVGAGPLRSFFTITLPLAALGIMASAIFVFLESLDEFTCTYFVGTPDVTALILLIPSVGFMLVVERYLRADVLAKVGN